MMANKIWLIDAVALSLGSLKIFGSEKPAAPKTLNIANIPYSLEIGSQVGEAKIINKSVSLTAFKGSDLFVGTDATSITDSVPRVLFQPKGDFIFSAKVNADFKNLYDGGA